IGEREEAKDRMGRRGKQRHCKKPKSMGTMRAREAHRRRRKGWPRLVNLPLALGAGGFAMMHSSRRARRLATKTERRAQACACATSRVAAIAAAPASVPRQNR